MSRHHETILYLEFLGTSGQVQSSGRSPSVTEERRKRDLMHGEAGKGNRGATFAGQLPNAPLVADGVGDPPAAAYTGCKRHVCGQQSAFPLLREIVPDSPIGCIDSR
jgi:hypothetical protein